MGAYNLFKYISSAYKKEEKASENGLYVLFKYMRVHKYADKLTPWKEFNNLESKVNEE